LAVHSQHKKKIMKKVFLSFITLFTAGALMAQAPIPNGDFENWNGNTPNGWGTSDGVIALLSPNVGGVARDTNAANVYSGTSSVVLTTKTVTIPTVGTQNIPGVVSLGTLSLNFQTFTPEITGFGYSDRPDSISFAYKYSPAGGSADEGAVIVTLTRFVNGETEFVGNAFLQLAPTSSFDIVTAKIDYFTYFNPDTLLIQGLSSISQSGPAESKLWLDDLQFAGLDTAFKAYIRPFEASEACEGELFTLVTDDISGNTFEWFKDNVSTGITLPSYNANGTGNYHVKVIRDGVTYYSDTIPVTFFPAPTVTLSLIDSLCNNDPVINLEGGLPLGGEYSGPGVSGNSFSPTTAGNGSKQITYTYEDANGCVGEATDVITVRVCTGIEILAKGVEAKVYPNPASNFIVVDVNEKLMGGKTLLYDAAGKVVSETTISNNKSQVNTTSLPTGTYFIKILKADGKLAVTGNLSVIK
jgi:hypothetical protein